jgi:hypothetical protein
LFGSSGNCNAESRNESMNTSVVRSKAANGGQVKTGQRTWPGT